MTYMQATCRKAERGFLDGTPSASTLSCVLAHIDNTSNTAILEKPSPLVLCRRIISPSKPDNNMPPDLGVTPAVLSAVSGALATSIKITEKVYEIIAVGEQSRSLLTTINQVNQQLETAKTLRRRKSGLLSPSEKVQIEQTFASTEEALNHVAKLVERTRVDQQIHGGKVGLRSRMQFVLRDSPKIVRSVTTPYLPWHLRLTGSDDEPDTAWYCQPEPHHGGDAPTPPKPAHNCRAGRRNA